MRGNRIAGRIAAATIGLIITLGWPAAAQAQTQAQSTAPGLSGTASKDTYQDGEPLALNFTVTNNGPAPCKISSLADGVLSITAMSVDGKPVQPSLGYVAYTDSLTSQLTGALRTVAPKGTQALAVRPSNDATLQSVSLSPTGENIAARWPMAQHGKYAVSAAYLYPPSLAAPDVCRGVSVPATVSFTVGAARGDTTTSFPLLAVIIGAAVLLLLIVLIVWLSRRKSRNKAALIAVIATAMVAGQMVLMVVSPAPADARIVIHPEPFPGSVKDPMFTGQVQGCIRSFKAEDGSGDPSGIIPWLESLPQQIDIWKYDGQRSETVGESAADAQNGKGTNSGVAWNPYESAPYLGGVAPQDCSELYHELFHAYQNARGQSRAGSCTAKDGKEVPLSELDATNAENAYRRYRGLPERQGYGTTPFSAVPDKCQPSKPKPPTKPKPNHSDEDPNTDTACADTANCGGSNGDPHLTTFDRHHYDMQAAGEFVAAKSANGDLEIQVRQMPYPGSSDVSLNRAVAMNVAGDRIGIYQDGDQPRLHVNGKPATVNGVQPLPRGGRIAHVTGDGRDAYLMTWPDGSRVWTGAIGGWGLRMDTELAPARKGAVQGLLGDFDGKPENDLRPRNGQPLPEKPSYDQLYKEFAKSWRVTPAESLFEYEPNQDTRTFTIEDFPAREIKAESLPARAAAESICRSMNVTEQPFLDNCVVDVALTGHADFAATAADEQAVVKPVDTPSPDKPIAHGTGVVLRDGNVVADALHSADEAHEYKIETGPATVIRLANLADEYVRIDLLGPAVPDDSPGFTITSNWQYRVLPNTTYTLKVHRDNGKAGGYGFRVVAAKERTHQVSVGDTIKGTIDVPGRLDRYAFTATTDSQLELENGTGCKLTVVLVEDKPAVRAYTPYGVCYGIPMGRLETGKRYQVVVWSDTWKAGETYSFRISAN
ncbi:NleD-like pathogen effector protein (putative zinc metallopeptidase) [Herbihabitans rhizosphaerae]|uniref:NleD-like pathogen effector protein (Putative zinc metallopeptidase) n=1 Tax=Herbihabitans rhizosphaerae TaxID=1872711 RepID=A0A4Q7KH79_9PSEU|nr:VWD domain-containing protein [Herbihabitans rhizosphaerae]RZS34250.1 NleD-like pathogen effector protein (putative zinc metallopeptidase) [Herbihabitans rhizosphaerae]